MGLQFLPQIAGISCRSAPDDESGNSLSLEMMLDADDGRFRHGRVGDKGAFQFGRAQAVAGYLYHIVDAAGDPETAVLIPLRPVAGTEGAGKRPSIAAR